MNTIKLNTIGEAITKSESTISEDVQGIINSLYSPDCNKDFNEDFSI